MVVFNKSKHDLSDLVLIVISNTTKINSNCFSIRIVADKLFDLCRDCEAMASIPQGAFAACKIRSYEENEMTVAKMKSINERPEMKNNFANKKLLEYSPVKYNSKLMNSIWGLYNRYSPHNIKGNEYEVVGKDIKKQQPMAVASYAIEKNLSMALQSGNEWNFP